MSPPRCRLTSEPIDPAALLAEIIAPSDGAALLFVGVVRNENDGQEVDHLEYDAYQEMAARTLETIVEEAIGRWEIGEIRVIHRTGRLELSEVSVAIAVSAPHRDGAYQASRYIIEELKQRVPIWKREGYVRGESAWLGGVDPTYADSNG